MRVAFDVDGTIVGTNETARTEVVRIMMMCVKQGHEVIIWSGGGKFYAEARARQFGLEAFPCFQKDKALDVDLCFDDMEVDLAKLNIQI